MIKVHMDIQQVRPHQFDSEFDGFLPSKKDGRGRNFFLNFFRNKKSSMDF